jgi:hypothetical protein
MRWAGRPVRRKKAATAGSRVGKKKSDTRWLDANGVEWDSRLESEVYESAKLANAPVRKCSQGIRPGEPGSDSFDYWHQTARRGYCRTCGGTDVGQSRTFTPDLLHDPALSSSGPGNEVHSAGRSERYYIDVKGYMRANKRALLRAFVKARPDIALRLLFQRDYKLSKTATITSWCRKTLRVPYVLWTGTYPSPQDWIMPYEPKGSKKTKKGVARSATAGATDYALRRERGEDTQAGDYPK